MKDSVLTDTTAPVAGPTAGGTAAARVEEVTAAVAQHVRALRAARGWSLDELAGRSGVSKGMVVQVEGAKTNPSVGTLCRLADAFGVTVARLLESAMDRTVHVSTADDAPLLWRGDRGGIGRLLAGVSEPDIVELWEWRLAPGERHLSPSHAAGTRELIHVLTGELTVTANSTDHAVGAGQTIEFCADRTHGYRNDGTEPARLMMVVIIPRP